MLHNVLHWAFYILLVLYLLIAIVVADDNFTTLWRRAKNAHTHHQVTTLKVIVGLIEAMIILLVSFGWLGVIIGHYITLPFRKK